MSLKAILNEQSVDDVIYNELIDDIESNLAIYGSGLAFDVLIDYDDNIENDSYSDLDY